MKNTIVCKNCGHENPFFQLICKNCKSYLRDKVYNIDLWKVISLLIESPRKGFELIVHSDHKNFITFITILLGIKLAIDTIFLSIVTTGNEPALGNFIYAYLIILAGITIIFLIFSAAFTFLNKLFGVENRLRDNLAIFIYSNFLHVFGLLILFPIELILFGSSLFSNNPSPFLLKETLAYTLLGFEGLIILWSVFLGIMGAYTQTKNIIYSAITGTMFNIILFCFLYLASFYLFNQNIFS